MVFSFALLAFSLMWRVYGKSKKPLEDMMYELMVRSNFAAAHQLREIGGSCEQLHGHTWKVEVFLQGEELEEKGILMDFRKVKSMVKKRIDKLDHHYLNDVLEGMNPTTENLARYLFEKLQESICSEGAKLSKIRVWESDDSCVSYEKSVARC